MASCPHAASPVACVSALGKPSTAAITSRHLSNIMRPRHAWRAALRHRPCHQLDQVRPPLIWNIHGLEEQDRQDIQEVRNPCNPGSTAIELFGACLLLAPGTPGCSDLSCCTSNTKKCPPPSWRTGTFLISIFLFVAYDKGSICIRAARRRLLYARRRGITGLQFDIQRRHRHIIFTNFAHHPLIDVSRFGPETH